MWVNCSLLAFTDDLIYFLFIDSPISPTPLVEPVIATYSPCGKNEAPLFCGVDLPCSKDVIQKCFLAKCYPNKRCFCKDGYFRSGPRSCELITYRSCRQLYVNFAK